MNHEELAEKLERFLDGMLSDAERQEFERHLHGCKSCSTELSAFREIRDRADGLARTVEPGRDLWPEIRDSISLRSHSRSHERMGARSAWWPRAAWGAAAAVMVVLAGVLMRPSDVPESAGTVPVYSRMVLGPVFAALELESMGAGKELQSVIDDSALSAGTTQVIEENIRILDAAIQETRAAWLENPEHPDLIFVLTGLYQRRLDLFHEATRLARQRLA